MRMIFHNLRASRCRLERFACRMYVMLPEIENFMYTASGKFENKELQKSSA